MLAVPSDQSIASLIDANTLVHVATVNTLGAYDNAGLNFWNGQPISPTNMPTPEEDQLSAIWSFYVDPIDRNTLYILVSNVLDPNFGFITGTPFFLTALTGFQFALPVASPSYATFSGGFAVQGQTLVGPTGNSTPVDTTPGWHLSSVTGPTTQATYVINSASAQTASYAFTHYASVTGDIRILNGGVFQLPFDPTVNLLNADFADLTASASNGMGAYVEAGTLVFPVSTPEPASLVLLFSSLIAFAGCRWVAGIGRRR
jgi:hypothetical protein